MNTFLDVFVPGFINGKVFLFNKKVNSNDSFISSIIGKAFPLNITSTKYP